MKELTRVAYLVTHPIQYQVPLLRRIANEPGVDLTVFFCSDFSVNGYVDPGFGKHITWDVPLLDGYRHEFLPALGDSRTVTFWKPWNYGLWNKLGKGKFDAIWIHGYARFINWQAILMAKSLGIKVLIRDEATLVSAKRGLVKQIIKKIFFAAISKLSDGFLAIGSMNREYYLAHGVPEEKIFLMPYAVDNGFFSDKAKSCSANREALRASFDLQQGRPVVLYASKLSERKRPSDLLEAYVHISNKLSSKPYLLFIGDGEMRPSLEKEVERLKLGNDVRFLGFKNLSELPCYYELCDVFVLPSFHEPWGLVVNEAMNAGRAVIVTDQVGSGQDLVKQGENGYVFKAGDVNGLADALQKVLEDKNRCRAMGQRSLEIISQWGFEQDMAGLKQALDVILR